MLWTIPIAKLYHDQKGRPSLIGNASGLFTDGWTILINNGSGGTFGGGGIWFPRGGGSNLPWGGNNGLLRNGSSEHLADQIPRSYATRLARLRIGLTWNLWYLSWYPIQPPRTPNLPPNRKSLPYPIYNARTNLDAHVCVFCKAIQVNGEKNDVDIFNLFCFTLCNVISKWGENFMRAHPVC